MAADTAVAVDVDCTRTQKGDGADRTLLQARGVGAVNTGASYLEVADAQRLLTQAEIDDALARLGVWRGLLGVAIAAGDIQPFVNEVGP